jgi:UDP-glucose 4-epimerase
MRVLVTGAAGFVGSALLRRLAADGHEIVAIVHTRALVAPPSQVIATHALAALDHSTRWDRVFEGVDCVVHLAACVHAPRAAAGNYQAVNVDAALALAHAASHAGIAHFVFLSTIKVHGEISAPDAAGLPHRYTEEDPPAPADPYAHSKWSAEQELRRLESRAALAVTVLRPPLVYGPGVRANFISLLRAVDYGLPLPFAGVDNHRSLLYVDNLADAIVTVLDRKVARGRTYLVTDGRDPSTAELAAAVGAALGRRPRLFRCPPSVLRAAARLLGLRARFDRLLGSLMADDGRIRAELGWSPPYTQAEGIAATVAWYRGRA